MKFKGWQVLGGGFFNAMLLAGIAIYSYSLFVLPIEKEFNLTREQANFGIMGLYIGMMFWAVFVGKWLERYSAKWLSILGGLAFGLGFMMIYFAPNPTWILVAAIFPIGFGFTAAGPFLENALATRWFTRMRGRALGIAAIASSAGGFVAAPIVGAIMESFGWRVTTLSIAIGIPVVVTLVSAIFIVGRPEDIDQHPDGDLTAQAATSEDTLPTKFINRKEFWFIALGAGLLLGSDQALLASMAPYGEELGFSKQQAANLIAAITGSAIAGKFAVGWLAERYDKRLLFSLVCVFNIIFLITVLMTPAYHQLLIVAAIVGLAIGGVYPVWTTLTAQYFGRGNFARVIGAMNLITVPLMLMSITIAGRTRDVTGNYDLAFKIFIPQVILSALIIALLRQPKSIK